MSLPSTPRPPDRRRSPIDLHHDQRFRDITELPWEPPPCAPIACANIAVEFSGMAPDYARAAMATIARGGAGQELQRAAERD